MKLLKSVLIFGAMLSSTPCYTSNFIEKETLAYGDIRYTISAQTESSFSEKDTTHLKEFLDNPNTFSGILCTDENLSMVKEKLLELNSTQKFYVRTYQNNPWILTEKAFDKLPIIDKRGYVNGSLTILTIEPTEGDIRFVLVKDNKKYAMNCGGTYDPEDGSPELNMDQVFKNIASRELKEEIKLSIPSDQLRKAGSLNFQGKNSLLNLTYKNKTTIFSCHLNPFQSQKWMSDNQFVLTDNIINAYKYNNDEIEWVYILKPDFLTKEESLMLPTHNGSVRVGVHHAVAPAVILKGEFNCHNVITDRMVNYLQGKVECNDTIAIFG